MLREKIGNGSFGNVYRVTGLNGEEYAEKEILSKSDSVISQFSNEYKIFSNFLLIPLLIPNLFKSGAKILTIP